MVGPACVSPQVDKEEDDSNPLHKLFLGPEKLLSLFSDRNWGNYCLSYLLTNRDYSGVLGLAWEGRAGETPGLGREAWDTQTHTSWSCHEHC